MPAWSLLLLVTLVPFSLVAQSATAVVSEATQASAGQSSRIDLTETHTMDPEVDQWDRSTTSMNKADSLLLERWELDSDPGEFIFRPYRPVYFFPVFYTDKLNLLPTTGNPDTSLTQPLEFDHNEAKFQLSFKTKLVNDLFDDNGDLWLAYTQTSRWQVYSEAESRPFRETNHEPEFILAWRTDYQLLGYTGRLLSLRFNHQSNGREEPLSRSWNRAIVTVGLERDDWVILFSPWWRVPESTSQDENPDIENYVGRAELQVVHRRHNSLQLSARLRHSLKSGDDSRGSVQLDWSYACFDRLRCHAQLFHGYGESLIDYNHRSTALGLGVNLLEWF